MIPQTGSVQSQKQSKRQGKAEGGRWLEGTQKAVSSHSETFGKNVLYRQHWEVSKGLIIPGADKRMGKGSFSSPVSRDKKKKISKVIFFSEWQCVGTFLKCSVHATWTQKFHLQKFMLGVIKQPCSNVQLFTALGKATLRQTRRLAMTFHKCQGEHIQTKRL